MSEKATALNKACKLHRRVELEVLFGLGYATFPLVKEDAETSYTQDVKRYRAGFYKNVGELEFSKKLELTLGKYTYFV